MVSLFKIVFFLALCVALVSADIDVSIPSPLTTTLTAVEDHFFGILQMDNGDLDATLGGSNSQTASGVLSPCVWHYWRLDASQWANDFSASDYLHINLTNTNADFTIPSVAPFTLLVRYVTNADDWNSLPTTSNYDYILNVSATRTDALIDNWMEIPPCRTFDSGFYWFALGQEPEADAFYTLEVSRRRPLGLMTNGAPVVGSQIDELQFGTPFVVVNDTRLFPGPLTSPFPAYGDQTNQEDQDRIRQWRYFSFVYDPSDYAPGAYITVNVSNVTTFSQNPFVYEDYSQPDASFLLAVNFETVPYYLLPSVDILSGEGANECKLSACAPGCDADCSTRLGPYCNPGLIPASVRTASLTINPSSLQFGTYYVGVRLPTAHYDSLLAQQYVFLETSYTILVDLVKPTVATIATDGTPVVGLAPLTNFNYLAAADYYRFQITAADAGRNLAIRLSNINGVASAGDAGAQLTAQLRFYDGVVGETPDFTLPNLETSDCPCFDYVDTVCTSCDECRITLFSCQLAAGDYFLSVTPTGSSSPVSYHLSVELYDDPTPEPLLAGVPVFGSLSYGQYHFYELVVPELSDTSLFVELFVNHAKSPVSVQMLFNATPGETCYPNPDFKCQSSTSCYFFVDSCLLAPGSYFFSVYGLDDKTGYSVSTDYTLWVDFETAWELRNNVTYTDHVRVGGYNHYYFLAENVVSGSWFTVEVDNIDGTPVNAYINYQHLAGECPCYASFRNCTGFADLPPCPAEEGDCTVSTATPLVQWDLDAGESNAACCKLQIDACSFRDGIWYVSVQSEADPFDSNPSPQSTSGYTITAIVHPPPVVYQLPFNYPLVDFINPFQLHHYRLVGQYGADEGNLVLTLTWMQDNCGRYTDLTTGEDFFNEFDSYYVQQLTDGGQMTVRVEHGDLALPECYEYPFSCTANRGSSSSCVVIVPWCVWRKWADTTFVSVEYIPVFDQNYAQFTLRASVETEPVVDILPQVSYHGVVNTQRYVHYTLDVNPLIQNNYRLELDIYYNDDRPSPTLNLQINAPAGGERSCSDSQDCQTKVLTCTDSSRCHWDFDPCDMAKLGDGLWYFTIFGDFQIEYDYLAEFTLEANFVPAVHELATGNPRERHTTWAAVDNGHCGSPFDQIHVESNDVYFVQRHYRIILEDLPGDGTYYRVSFNEFQGSSGTVTVFHNVDAQAGVCDCYSYTDSQSQSFSSGCPTGQGLDWVFSDCDGSVAGVHYFAVYVAGGTGVINYQVEAVQVSPDVVRNFGTITNTDGNGNQFHLGVGSLLYLFDLADDIDSWILWNSANEVFDQTFTWNIRNLYYTFTVSADSQVFYALYNVVQPACDYNVTMDVDFVGPATGVFECALGGAVRLCSNVGPGADVDGSRVSCFGAIDRCLTSDGGQYLLRLTTSYDLPEYDDFEYGSFIGSSSFNMKLFTQTPVQLTSTSTSESNRLNVTHYLSPSVQEFELSGVITSGLAPMTQIVFRNVDTPINIYLRPAPLAGEPGDFCQPNCYEESCIEIRGGWPIDNVDFFDVTTPERPSPAALASYGFQCGSGQSDCTISLLPCALLGSSTTWYMTVDPVANLGIQSDFANGDNVYQLYWFNLADRRSATNTETIPRADINARERYPGVEFCSDPNCANNDADAEGEIVIGEMDSFVFFTFEILESDVTRIFNGTKDNSIYTQLEVQIYDVDVVPSDPSFGQSDWIAYISQGEDPIIPTISALPLNLTSISESCCGDAWTCYGGSCDARGSHYVVPPCCLEAGTYWIAIRLTTPGEHGFRVRVRLVEQSFSAGNLADFVDSQTFGSGVLTPSTYPSIASGLTNEVSGVEPNNFVHFYTTILPSQISNGESLIFNMSIDDVVTAERNAAPVTLYVRRGAPAGRAYNSITDFANQDYCLGETYSCGPLIADDQFCVIEIPNCQLFADDYYFSIYNGNWFADYESGLTDPTAGEQSGVEPRDPFYNNAGFELNAYFRPAAYTLTGHTLTLSTDVEVCTNHTEGGLDFNTLHYLITVEDSAIFSCAGSASTSPECFYENVLVIEVWTDDVTATDLDVYLSTPNTLSTSNVVTELAFQPGSGNDIPANSLSNCPASLTTDSSSGNIGRVFYFTTNACDDFDLRSGDYYLSISVTEYRSYSICTHIEHVLHEVLNTFSTITPPSSIDDETASLLVGTDVYNRPSDVANEIYAFYYKFEISEAQANDQLNYLQVQVTDVNDCTDQTFTACSVPDTDDFVVTVFYNENCETWSASGTDFVGYQSNLPSPSTTQIATFRETVIDETGLVLCSLRAGTYRISVINPSSFGFTINVLLRHALSVPAVFDEPIFSQIWQSQYHVYSLDVTETAGKFIVATLDQVRCGTLEMWAKFGNVAGPSVTADAHSPQAVASCDYCANFACSATPTDPCYMAIGDLYGGAAQEATWFFTVHGASQFQNTINTQVDPVTYAISFAETGFEFVTDTEIGCPVSLDYPTSFDCNEPEPVLTHQQFVFNLELQTIFSWSNIAFRSSDGSALAFTFDVNRTAYFADSSRFGATDDTTTTTDIFLYGGARDDASTYENVIYGPLQFNAWITGPVDSTITVNRYLPYVPIIHPQIHYYSSIAEGSWQYYKVSSLSVDYNALYITASKGTISLQFFSWFDFFTQSELGADPDTLTTSDTFPSPISIPSNTRYLAVYGENQNCESPCQAIEYHFWYTNFIAHDSLLCDTFQCDTVGDVWNAEYHIYDVEPFNSLTNYAQDVNYSVTVQQVILNAGNPYSDPDSFYTQLAWPISGSQTNNGWIFGGDAGDVDTYPSNLCPFDAITVQAENDLDSPCFGSDFSYQIEYTCVDYPVQDITTSVLTTGYTYCSSTETLKTYSFDLRAEDLEFALLDVYLTTSSGDAELYQNLGSIADEDCTATVCGVSNSVYFYTIRADPGTVWTFYARLVTVPSFQLTIDQSSSLISFPNDNYRNYQVYFVDVAAGFSVDSYLQFEILSYMAAAGGSYPLTTLLTDSATSNLFYRANALNSASCPCNRYSSSTNIVPLSAGTVNRAEDAENPIVVNHCRLQAGRYYLWVQINPNCREVHFRVRPLLSSHAITVLPVPATPQTILSQYTHHEFLFYSVQAGANTAGQVRLSDVLGGHLNLYLLANKLPNVPDYANINGPTLFDPLSAFQGTPDSASCPCGFDYSCTTIAQDSNFDNLNDDCVSCAILLPNCVWSSQTWFIGLRVAVASGASLQQPIAQEDYFEPVEFVLHAADEPFTVLNPSASDALSVIAPASARAAYAAGNWQHFIYSFSTNTIVQSITVEIEVSGDQPQDGVYATLSTDSCFRSGSGFLLKNVWCAAEYDSFVCEFQIPTRAEHTGDTNYYIDVYGRRGSFELTVVLGSDNCEVPATGLDFCAGYVDYPVWSVENYAQLDAEASCRYESILEAFNRDGNDCTPVCWLGITDECDDLLKRFSCYESFAPCNTNGFITSTCSQFCDHIESTCNIAFASVGLEQYDCQSSRYIDQNAGVCAGSGFEPLSPFDF